MRIGEEGEEKGKGWRREKKATIRALIGMVHPTRRGENGESRKRMAAAGPDRLKKEGVRDHADKKRYLNGDKTVSGETQSQT